MKEKPLNFVLGSIFKWNASKLRFHPFSEETFFFHSPDVDDALLNAASLQKEDE